MAFTRFSKQYHILEALSACGKVEATAYREDITPEFVADTKNRLAWLFHDAVLADIPVDICTQTYLMAKDYPYENNSQTIDRAIWTAKSAEIERGLQKKRNAA